MSFALYATEDSMLQRLFTTEHQRQELDILRHQKDQDISTSDHTTQDFVETSELESGLESVDHQTMDYQIVLGGIVSRTNQRHTVWINQRPYRDAATTELFILKPEHISQTHICLFLKESQQYFELRVGEQFIFSEARSCSDSHQEHD